MTPLLSHLSLSFLELWSLRLPQACPLRKPLFPQTSPSFTDAQSVAGEAFPSHQQIQRHLPGCQGTLATFLSPRDLVWAQQSGLGRAEVRAFEELPVLPVALGGCWGQGQAPGVQPVTLGRPSLLVTGRSPRRKDRLWGRKPYKGPGENNC